VEGGPGCNGRCANLTGFSVTQDAAGGFRNKIKRVTYGEKKCGTLKRKRGGTNIV